MTNKSVARLYVEIGKERMEEIRDIVQYIPGETLRSFATRAVDREVQRYYKYKKFYREGNTHIVPEDDTYNQSIE